MKNISIPKYISVSVNRNTRLKCCINSSNPHNSHSNFKLSIILHNITHDRIHSWFPSFCIITGFPTINKDLCKSWHSHATRGRWGVANRSSKCIPLRLCSTWHPPMDGSTDISFAKHDSIQCHWPTILTLLKSVTKLSGFWKHCRRLTVLAKF